MLHLVLISDLGMKKYIFLLVCLFVCCSAFSQGMVFNKFEYRKGVDRSRAVIIGLKGGVSFANMYYSDKNLKSLTMSLLVRPDYGIFVEVPLKYNIAVGMDILKTGKGTDISYNSHGDVNSPVRYTIKSDYLDVRIPVSYKFIVTYEFMPFVYVAPYASYCLGGEISLNQKKYYEYDQDINTTIDIGNANMRQFDFGAVVGAGLRYDFNFTSFSIVTKIEAGYNFGLRNTYSKMEMENGFGNNPTNHNIVNVNAYNLQGKRFNRGFEAMISIGLPLKFIDRGCSNFGSRKERIY